MFKATGVGRVVRTPEVQESKGTKYANITLAVDPPYGKDLKTLFLKTTLFNEAAERIVKAGVKQGSLLQISGDIAVKEYEKNEGGKGQEMQLLNLDWSYIPGSKKAADDSAPTMEDVGDELDMDNEDIQF